jgi:hypothetical protein
MKVNASVVLRLATGALLAGAAAHPLIAPAAVATRDCPVAITGDVNMTGTLTSSDVIFLVNYIFRSGPVPSPCEAAGDVSCDAVVTTSDIIRLVNFIFKGPNLLCNVCPLIEAGTWICNAAS